MIKNSKQWWAPILGLAFIYTLIFSSILPAIGSDKIDLKLISSSKEWRALLYYTNNSFSIKDTNFYVSTTRSLEAELEAFLKSIDNDKKIICRFPGRYTYLSKVLGYSLDELKNCKELYDFKMRAPLKNASVVFASENISIPSSMMGHIYLKIEGINHQGNEVEHAISFFTDVDNYNIPKLIFDTLVVGKKGFYALTPNAPLIDKYLSVEGRNVWEYELKLDHDKKELLQNHLYELKDINLKYYFHTFNCATLINRIVNVVSDKEISDNHIWVTPLDVVRDIRNEELVGKTDVYLASKWKIKALLENYNFDKKTISEIKNKDTSSLLKNLDSQNAESSFLNVELMKEYYQYEKENDDTELLTKLIKKNYSHFNLDLSNYKNPNLTKSTSQILTQYEFADSGNVYKATWLPASHFLEDDSSNYIYESELQIARMTIGYNEKNKKLFLDELNIYSASSFQATDVLTGGISGKVRIGYYNYLNSDLKQKRSAIVEALVGKTLRVHHDVDTFGLMGMSYTEANRAMFAPDLETGFILRGLFKMKTIFSLKYHMEDINKGDNLLVYNLKHFFDFNQYGLLLEYNNFKNQDHKYAQRFSFGVKFYF